ncbi:MAG: hypothetical protein P4M08_15305 [Oligoflexia bacterium]|nr:hypothetical protein [Oligoflexia bacterium]
MIDTTTNSPVTEDNLAVLHEKKLHLFLFDPSLQEFRHEHPVFDSSSSTWHVSSTLNTSGNYWVWVQGELADTQQEFTASSRLDIEGGDPALPPASFLGDVRTGVDGISQVTVSNNKITAAHMTMLTVTMSRTDGSQPDLAPYLGAPAHVVAVPIDGSSLIHVHPMAMGGANSTQMMLHTEFPNPGDYRLWVQFLDGGILRTVPLSVTVLR